MYALKNKVQLIGNLGNNPQIKNTSNGNKMAKISLATNESFKNAKGEMHLETTWHNVIAWGKPAEIAEKYLSKGKEVAIEGKLCNRSYTDKEGIKRYITEIIVSEILIIGNKNLVATDLATTINANNSVDLPF